MEIENIYIGLKDILNGCDHIDDIDLFKEYCNNCNINPVIISNILENKQYNETVSLDMIIKADTIVIKNEIIKKYITELIKDENFYDIILQAFDINMKNELYNEVNSYIDIIKTNINIKDNVMTEYLSKIKHVLHLTCPHCSIKTNTPTKYNICFRCYNDWCGVCGKKMCKSWIDDSLHNSNNRAHFDNCCINYAKNKQLDTAEYCSC
jgi:hypothetical protein